MGQGLPRREPLLRVSVEETADEVFGLGGHSIPFGRMEIEGVPLTEGDKAKRTEGKRSRGCSVGGKRYRGRALISKS
jgi:hypothetical protein